MANFFLIGYMGAGKSTVGKQLAAKLKFDFVDLDKMIEETYQQTITEIFATKGEAEFRSMEHYMLKNLITKNRLIISCGGGTPCYYENMELMNRNGITIYLKMSTDTLISRLLPSKQQRPLIANKSEEELRTFVSTQLEKREDIYHRAHYVVKGKDLNVTELASFIKEQIGV